MCRLKACWKAARDHFKDNAAHYAYIGFFVAYLIFLAGFVVLIVLAFKWVLLAYCAWLMVLGQQKVLRELGFLRTGS